ncbi:MAG: alpha/beta fold hydrolase [Candidatus Spechtbacteria bacterium]|nr:alpha/beta fold hydrolase [Candidatus Spechtbacteria bacterium]
MNKITLTTKDNIKIIGDFYPADSDNAPAVILLHMMPATKESWQELAPILVERGFQVLAIDERGHGESTENGTLNFREFSGEQQQAKMLDVLAAREFFVEKGVSVSNIFVGGASIGANLAIQYLAENPECRAVFGLSPGYNYYGIQTLPLMESTRAEQNIFLVASKDDPNVPDSYKAVEELQKAGQARKTVKIFDTGGHGTNIFKEHPEFMRELVDWLEEFIV